MKFLSYAGHLILLNNKICDGLVMWQGWEDRECMQSFSGEISWETAVWKTKKGMEHGWNYHKSCLMAGFGVSGVESLGFIIRELVTWLSVHPC